MVFTLPAHAPAAETSSLNGPSFVLHETARAYHWAGLGPLSIKTFRGGRAVYTVDGTVRAVDDDHYLVLNHGQPYRLDIEAEAPVESLCVFFAAGLAASGRHSLTSPTERLLDEPEPPAPAALDFYERAYPHDAVLSPGLARLRAGLRPHGAEPGWLSEQLHGLLERLLLAHAQVQAEVAALPMARAATRAELYRRLHRARDFAAACYDSPLTLDDLARAAHLSPNHLLRSFRAAFGLTPHQFITQRRLARAQALLAGTGLPVTEVCLAVGFQSLGSFSTLFRRRFGLSPEQYRRQANR